MSLCAYFNNITILHKLIHISGNVQHLISPDKLFIPFPKRPTNGKRLKVPTNDKSTIDSISFCNWIHSETCLLNSQRFSSYILSTFYLCFVIIPKFIGLHNFYISYLPRSYVTEFYDASICFKLLLSFDRQLWSVVEIDGPEPKNCFQCPATVIREF